MRVQRNRLTRGGLLGIVAACGCAPAPAQSTSFAATAPVETTTELSSTGGTSGQSGSTSDSMDVSTSTGAPGSSTGMQWDLGGMPDGGSNTPPGCKGKVDFLFAISQHPNMAGAQAQLIASFKPFVESILALGGEFEDFDFHIMVVNSEDDWGSDYCDDKCKQDGVCDLTPEYPCDYKPTACDATFGAGIVYTAGRDAANKSCGLAAGKRYLDTTTWNLEETFACIAQVGTVGHDDLGNALEQAVTTQRDACNEGVLRDDALLVVVNIMRGDVQPGVKGTPEEWANALLAAKGGDLDAIIMLGMNAASTLEECLDEDWRSCQMLPLFPHHVFGNTELPSYAPAFQETVDLIDVACSEFIPG